jgi:hypothetical protein
VGVNCHCGGKSMSKTPTKLNNCFGAALLLSTMLWSSPAAAVGSLTCIYGIMTEVRVAMEFCGDRLEPANEAAYQTLRTDLRKFINENARLSIHRIEPDYDEQIRQHMKVRTEPQSNNSFCAHQDYAFGKKLLLELLQPEATSEIRNRLDTPSDPSKGDCF